MNLGIMCKEHNGRPAHRCACPNAGKSCDENVFLRLTVFVGSRACAANHYVIAEKCPYKCPHLRPMSA